MTYVNFHWSPKKMCEFLLYSNGVAKRTIPEGMANRTLPILCMREPAPVGTKCSSYLCERLAPRQFINSHKAKRNELELHPLCHQCADLKTLRIYFNEGDLYDALKLMNAKKAEKKADGQ